MDAKQLEIEIQEGIAENCKRNCHHYSYGCEETDFECCDHTDLRKELEKEIKI